MTDGMKLLVQFVHKGDPRGDVQIYDVGVRNFVEILDQRTEAVPVARNQDASPAAHFRGDAIVPAGEKSCHSILQAFRGGELLPAKMTVARIVARMPWIFLCEGGRTSEFEGVSPTNNK